MYQALLVDYGGVLTTDQFACLRSFCVREGLPREALIDLWTKDPAARALFTGLETGAIGQREFEWKLAPMLGVPDEHLIKRITADLRPEPLMLTAVEKARHLGLVVCCLSNSWGTVPFNPYAPWRLEERFDALVISEQVGMRKPDPAIYQLALDRVGLPGDACVLIDDIAHNLPPAHELGIATILQRDADQAVRDLEELLGTVLR